jgi:hypothetical protein
MYRYQEEEEAPPRGFPPAAAAGLPDARIRAGSMSSSSTTNSKAQSPWADEENRCSRWWLEGAGFLPRDR